MTRVAAGDTDAQRALVLRLTSRIRRPAQTLLHDAADSDDAAQLGLVSILQSASSYRGESALERWADRIAVRVAMRLARERRLRAAPFEAVEAIERFAVRSTDEAA